MTKEQLNVQLLGQVNSLTETVASLTKRRIVSTNIGTILFLSVIYRLYICIRELFLQYYSIICYNVNIKDIDINSTIDKPIDKKTLEDFTIVIIDYCLRHSSSICYVNVSKKRFSKLLCFLFIEIQFDSSYVYNDLSEAYISLFLHDTIFNLFNYELFRLTITSYISQIENIQLSIEELNNELISYILYSEPLFSSDEYIKSLSKITYHDIQRKLIELCE